MSINPAASARQVGQAVQAQLRQWKDERDLGEQRDRSEKYREYLQVWDLREGWTGADYDRTQETTLVEIARILHRKISTVASQYRSAFEMIVGYPYSPELWFRVFGSSKLSELWVGPAGVVSRRRPFRGPSPRPVPEGVLQPASDSERADGIVSSAAQPDGNESELIQDILGLIRRGLTDDQIVESLELAPSVVEAVAYVRRRHVETA